MATAQKDLFAYAADNGPSIVYQAVNTVNGKIYVGITRKNMHARFMQHVQNARKGSKGHFQSAIRKYGEEAFLLFPLAWCDSYREAQDAERRWIEKIKPHYNKTLGGEGVLGHRHSAESKRKMSAAKAGRSPWPTGEYPAEVREKIVAHLKSRKGKPITEKHRLACIATAKLGNAARRKAVVCLTDGKTYASTTDAAKAYGTSSSMIVHYCRGRFKARSGLEFSYVERGNDN